jgi:hypothetical protein
VATSLQRVPPPLSGGPPARSTRSTRSHPLPHVLPGSGDHRPISATCSGLDNEQ